MFFRARRAACQAWFNFRCNAILRTPAIVTGEDSATLVSMVCHGDVLMYLLAVKSFCRRIGRTPAVVVLDDGSLTAEDYATISRHLTGARMISIGTISTRGFPKGNCWERLLLISELVEDTYVIQLDCDTLTLAPIAEVADCLLANRSFTLLGDRSYPHIETMREACVRLRSSTSLQVQAVCERSFDRLPVSDGLYYLRGNAGFTGFAKGSIDRHRVRWFSDLMRGLARDQWDEWGSEQLTSNLLIANSARAYLLDARKYLSYWAHPDVDYERAAFLHFIGPHRYAHGLYQRHAKLVIAALDEK